MSTLPIEAAPQTISDDIERREDSVWDLDPYMEGYDPHPYGDEFDVDYDAMRDHSEDYDAEEEEEDPDDFFRGSDDLFDDELFDPWEEGYEEPDDEEKVAALVPAHLISKWELS